MSLRPAILLLTLLLAGCDLSAIPGMGPDPRIAQREADSKAVGGACRYGLRSIEDCYTLNPKAVKAHVFTGWKDMDQYMRDNKIDGVAASVQAAAEDSGDASAEKKPDKPSAKTTDKSDAKSEVKPEAKADTKTAAKTKPKAEPNPGH